MDTLPLNVDIAPDGTASVHFALPSSSRPRTMLLETIASRNPYLQYIRIPMPDNDFDVTFYPEGGSLMQGTSTKVAFKAMKSDGQATCVGRGIRPRRNANQRCPFGSFGNG